MGGIYALGDIVPTIHESAFIHPDATLIGDVRIGAESSIWPGAVIRADDGPITIGDQTSIQDGSVLHTIGEHPTRVGSRCTVGHIVHLEGCHIEDDVLVGNGSVVLHRAVVESWALVGSNAVVTADQRVPSRAMALGIPAKIRPDCVAPELITGSAQKYVERSARYRSEMRRID